MSEPAPEPSTGSRPEELAERYLVAARPLRDLFPLADKLQPLCGQSPAERICLAYRLGQGAHITIALGLQADLPSGSGVPKHRLWAVAACGTLRSFCRFHTANAVYFEAPSPRYLLGFASAAEVFSFISGAGRVPRGNPKLGSLGADGEETEWRVARNRSYLDG